MPLFFSTSFLKRLFFPGVAVWAFLAGLVYLFFAAPLPQSGVIHASCGDWLQHSDSEESDQQTEQPISEQTPEDSPRCQGPGCQQAPVVPATTGFQTLKEFRPQVGVANQLDSRGHGRRNRPRFSISDDRNAPDGHRQRTDRPPNR